MLEFKLLTATVLAKPKIAIVLSSIQAEPGAKHGIWCGSRQLQDMFIICRSTAEAVDIITRLNNPKEDVSLISIDKHILQYLDRTSGNTNTTKERIR